LTPPRPSSGALLAVPLGERIEPTWSRPIAPASAQSHQIT
jgi:hypothetical protein